MTTAMITASFTGLVRAVGMLLTIIILAEFIYFILFSQSTEEAGENLFNPARLNRLFSGTFEGAKENSVCNPYRFKKPKLIAQAMGFIFFIHPGHNRLAICICKNQSSPGNYFSTSENNYSSTYPENYHSSTLLPYDVTRKLFANRPVQNTTTCL